MWKNNYMMVRSYILFRKSRGAKAQKKNYDEVQKIVWEFNKRI